MTKLEFTAFLVGTDISYGVVTTGASTELDKDPVQYVTLQIPERASSLKEIYLEVDDQINGSHGNLVHSGFTESQWILELLRPLNTYPGVTRIVVNLSPDDIEELQTSLALVAGVAEWLVPSGA